VCRRRSAACKQHAGLGQVNHTHTHPPKAQVTHVVSQGDIIKLMWQNRACFGPTLSATIEQLELDAGGRGGGRGVFARGNPWAQRAA
jgi:hypothetical protein